MGTKTLGDTLYDMEATALVDTLADRQPEVEAEIPVRTLCDLEAKTLVGQRADTLARWRRRNLWTH